MHQQQISVHFEPDHLPVQTVTPPRLLPYVMTTSTHRRRVAIAVDLSDESAFAVRWAVQNYLRRGDAVVLLHVQPTSVLYGADWGISDENKESPSPEEDLGDLTTSAKAARLAGPLVDANIPFKIHIVKDHDLKERLCLEVERLGLSAMIMGSRGFGAWRKRTEMARLGSVSDYCVQHCVCPVVVVRYPDGYGVMERVASEINLRPVQEDEYEYHDADDDVDKLEPCFT